MVTQKLTIRLDETELPEIRMVSGDIGREIQIEVYAREDSENPIDLETYSADITLIKPDNTFIMDHFNVDKYELPENAGAVSGSGYYQIKIFTAGSHQIYTGQGRFLVDDMILSDDVIESSSIAFGDRFPEDFATKTWVDEEIEHAGIGTYVAGNPAGEETMPPLVRLQINDDIYPISHKIEEMEDADITAPAEGDVLTYDADDQKWKNEPLDIPDPTVTKTATGNPIEFSDGADAPLVKCVTEITGSQDLHGYDKPWVGGAGVNLLNTEVWQASKQGTVTATRNADGSYHLVGTLTSPQWLSISSNNDQYLDVNLPSDTYTVSTNDGSKFPFYINDGITQYTNPQTFTGAITNIRIILKPNIAYDDTLKVQIEKGSQATAWTPYKNICPITAYTEGEIEVRDGDGNTTTHTTTFPSAIYRGSEDVVNGEVSEEWVKIVLDGSNDEEWYQHNTYTTTFGLSITSSNYDVDFGSQSFTNDLIANSYKCEYMSSSTRPNGYLSCYVGTFGRQQNGNWIAIRDDRFTSISDFKTWLASNPLEIAYKRITKTDTVTPTNLPIKSLSGYNHIESSTGEMEVEYITQTYDAIMEATKLDNMKVYSTDEKVVGKWVDGSDVYESVIITEFNNATPQYTVDLSNIGGISTMPIFVSHSVLEAMEGATPIKQIVIPAALNSGYSSIAVNHQSNAVTGKSYLTVRYIKL